MANAILLISGGLDSVVLAYYLKKIKKIKNLKFVFLDYNQKSLKEELFCVKKTAKKLNVKLKIIDVKWLGKISTSLINKKTGKKGLEKIKEKEELISWYVPCRNSIFLLIGLAIAESELISKRKKSDVYIGIKFEGELQFKDTTPKFLKQMNKTAKLCTQKGNIKFIAPFLKSDKENLIKLSSKLKIYLKNTYSCYIGGGFNKIKNEIIPIHCGICSGCKARKKSFKFSNTKDPSVYKN